MFLDLFIDTSDSDFFILVDLLSFILLLLLEIILISLFRFSLRLEVFDKFEIFELILRFLSSNIDKLLLILINLSSTLVGNNFDFCLLNSLKLFFKVDSSSSFLLSVFLTPRN